MHAQVWLLDTSTVGAQTLARWCGRLGGNEQARLARVRRPIRRTQFIAGRMLLRHALTMQHGAALDVTVTERPGLAPLVHAASSAIPHFSLSHSGDWVACAVSAACAVGLDVEVRDPSRDAVALAAQAFSSADAAAIAALHGAQRHAAFYSMWCGHEARYKLDNAGVSEGHVYHLPHPALEIALCTALPLSAEPISHAIVPMMLDPA